MVNRLSLDGLYQNFLPNNPKPQESARVSISAGIVNNFFLGMFNITDLTQIMLAKVSKFTVQENITPNEIRIPSYQMDSLSVWTLDHTNKITNYQLDMNIAKGFNTNVPYAVRSTVHPGIVRMVMLTQSDTRPDNNRVYLYTFSQGTL